MLALETEPRRMLIGDWAPPKHLEAAGETLMLPEEERSIKTYYDGNYSTDGNGIVFQRCGGGRRRLVRSSPY